MNRDGQQVKQWHGKPPVRKGVYLHRSPPAHKRPRDPNGARSCNTLNMWIFGRGAAGPGIAWDTADSRRCIETVWEWPACAANVECPLLFGPSRLVLWADSAGPFQPIVAGKTHSLKTGSGPMKDAGPERPALKRHPRTSGIVQGVLDRFGGPVLGNPVLVPGILGPD